MVDSAAGVPDSVDPRLKSCKCGCGKEYVPLRPWREFATNACRNRWHSRENFRLAKIAKASMDNKENSNG